MDIQVGLDVDVNKAEIEFIQHLEKELDAVLVKNGFTRTESNKSDDGVLFKYNQFGICVNPYRG